MRTSTLSVTDTDTPTLSVSDTDTPTLSVTDTDTPYPRYPKQDAGPLFRANVCITRHLYTPHAYR